VLRCRLHIGKPEVISDPDQGRACGSLKCLLERNLPGISPLHSSSEVMLASSVLPDPTQEISGFRFLCSYARVLVFRTTPKGRGSAQLCQIFSDKLPGTLGEEGNQYVEAAKQRGFPTGVCAR